MDAEDGRNCIKNLIAVAAADRKLDSGEKEFFLNVFKKLEIPSGELPILFREVRGDGLPFYPVKSREAAIKTLKMMLTMARADGSFDVSEKKIIHAFAKAIGFDREALAGKVAESGEESSSETPETPTDFSWLNIRVITDHFEKLEEFMGSLESMNASGASFLDFLREPSGDIVFMHAVERRKATVTRLEKIQKICSARIVPIMTRFQGDQIKYVHDLGIPRCMIEPVLKNEVIRLLGELFPGKG